jgi:hypothetical protein
MKFGIIIIDPSFIDAEEFMEKLKKCRELNTPAIISGDIKFVNFDGEKFEELKVGR